MLAALYLSGTNGVRQKKDSQHDVMRFQQDPKSILFLSFLINIILLFVSVLHYAFKDVTECHSDTEEAKHLLLVGQEH